MFTCKPASSLGQEENQPGHDSLCSSVTYLWGSGKPTAFLWTLVSSSLKWEVTLIPFRAVIKSDWRGGGACQPLSSCPHPVVPLETQEVKGYHDSVFYLLILLETKYLENPSIWEASVSFGVFCPKNRRLHGPMVEHMLGMYGTLSLIHNIHKKTGCLRD